MNPAERGQKRLLVLANLNLHYGHLGLVAWEEMFFTAQGQLDFHSMPNAEALMLRTECRLTNYSGSRLDAPVWVARPCQSAYFLVADLKTTSVEDITEAGYFIRPCE